MALTFSEWRREGNGTLNDYQRYLSELAATAARAGDAGPGGGIEPRLREELANATAALASGAEHDALYGLTEALKDILTSSAGGIYTRRQAASAWNGACDLVARDSGISLSSREESLVDLVVNAVGSLLDNPAMSLDDVITSNWQETDEGGNDITITEVRSWLS